MSLTLFDLILWTFTPKGWQENEILLSFANQIKCLLVKPAICAGPVSLDIIKLELRHKS